MIRVLLADDQVIIRRGIKAVLGNEPGIKVVAEARDGLEVLEQLKFKAKEVDIVLLDVEMPRMNGIEAAKEIAEKYPDIKIIVLTMYQEDTYIRELLRIRVSGYLFKEESDSKLTEAIFSVHSGKDYYGNEVKNVVMEWLKDPKPKMPSSLTSRERQILKLLGGGLTSQKIARKLGIKHSTVETHKRNSMKKTGCRNVRELAVYAAKHDLSKIKIS